MTKVIADISMSLDGFVTGPAPDLEHGLGHGGEPLHAWVFESDDPVDKRVLAAAAESSGAVVMGRKLFDIIDGPNGWTDDMGYGAEHALAPPFFVVTHALPDHVRLGLDFTFVTDGLESAIDQARAVAPRLGDDKHVVVMGGGNVIRQCLDAGLADELRIHLSPIVLGDGTPLFDGATRRQYEQESVEVSRYATHLTYVPC
jgi:dihydrofolate reductase